MQKLSAIEVRNLKDNIKFLESKLEKLNQRLITEVSARSVYQQDFTLYIREGHVDTREARCDKSVSDLRVNPIRVNGRFIKAEYGFNEEQLKDPEFCLEHELESHKPTAKGNLLCDDLKVILLRNKETERLIASALNLLEEANQKLAFITG